MPRSHQHTFSALAVGFACAIATSLVFAATDDAERIVIATAHATEASIERKNNTELVTFTVLNGEIPEPSFRYGIALYREGPDGAVLADRYLADERIALAPESSTKRTIAYIPPSGLSGSFRVMVEGWNAAGVPLTESFAGTIALSGGAGVSVIPGSCSLTVSGENTGRQYHLREGVDIGEDEELILSCAIANGFSAPVSVVPTFETRFRSFFGDEVPASGGSREAIELDAFSEEKVSVILPKAEEAQAYEVLVSFDSGEIDSNTVSVHYVVRGPSATIVRVSADKDGYRRGDVADVKFIWSGSADDFPGSRIGTGSPTAVSYRLAVLDKDRNTCAETDGELDGGMVVNKEVSLTRDCSGIVIALALLDASDRTLAAQEIGGPFERRQRNQFPVIVLLVSAIVIAVLAVLLRSRNKGNTMTTILLVSLALVLALFAFFRGLPVFAVAGPGTTAAYAASQGAFVYVQSGTMYSITCGNPLSQQGQPCLGNCINFDARNPASTGAPTSVSGRPAGSIAYNTTAPPVPANPSITTGGYSGMPINLAPITISGPTFISAGSPYAAYTFRYSDPLSTTLPNNVPNYTTFPYACGFLGCSTGYNFFPYPTSPTIPGRNQIYIMVQVDGSGHNPVVNANWFPWASPDAATMFPEWTYTPNVFWYSDAVYQQHRPEPGPIESPFYLELGPLAPGAHTIRARAVYRCWTFVYTQDQWGYRNFSDNGSGGCDTDFFYSGDFANWPFQLPNHWESITLSDWSDFTVSVGLNGPPSDPIIIAPDGLQFTSVLASAQSWDSDNNNITYYWDWNLDGVADTTMGPFASGSSPAAPTPATWGPGPHTFRVRVFDGTYYNPSGWMNYTINLRPAPNNPPSDPVVSVSPTGSSLTSYPANAWSTDPDGDDLQYGYDWDLDGSIDYLSPTVPEGLPGVDALTPVSWGPGPHTFRVLAMDHELTSANWGEGTILLSDTGTITLVTDMVICDAEADIPNMANMEAFFGVPTLIDGNTASGWIAAHPSCRPGAGYAFQWGYIHRAHAYPSLGGIDDGAAPGIVETRLDLIGDADGIAVDLTPQSGAETDNGNPYKWHNEPGLFTNASGRSVRSIPLLEGTDPATLEPEDHDVKVRQVVQPGGLTFSGEGSGREYSAETFCWHVNGLDARDHNNYEWIPLYPPAIGAQNVFHCVAFNVPNGTLPPPPTVSVTLNGSTLPASASIPSEGTFTLEMTSTNAASCTWSRTSVADPLGGDFPPSPIPVANGGPLQFNLNNTFSGWVGPATVTWTFTCDNGSGATDTETATLVIGTPVPALEISPPPGSLTFLDTYVGDSSTPMSFTVRNVGQTGSLLDVTVSLASPTGEFRCVPACPITFNDITPGPGEGFTVVFTPVAPAGMKTAILSALSSAGSYSQTLQGVAVLPITISGGLDFGKVVVSKWKELDLTITNIGTASLGVSGLNIPAPYTCVSTCTLDLGPGVPNVVRIRFTPPTVGDFPATASLTAYPSITFSLVGTGVNPFFKIRED